MELDSGVSSNPQTSSFTGYLVKATNVPLDFFKNRDVAKKYFRRFGKVKLIMFKSKRQTLIVEYTTEESLLNALDLAGEYDGKKFTVTRHYTEIPPKKSHKRSPSKSTEDPEWIPEDPEVRAELEAMGGFVPQSKKYNLRPEMMSVDPAPSEEKKTKFKWKTKSAKPVTPASPKRKPSGKDVSTDSALKSELFSVIRTPGFSVEEQYRILDARDKLIRLYLKEKESKKQGATQGTCPDMCPEKERLMREMQHQIALYEHDPDAKKMNPRLAVKQYSRSSADQETPLPSELRPVNVLQMTMGYLMHRIIDLCESPDVNIAEWYHFLWDRTRGIRKDITQQELCCQGSVELVEQCARFHIFCSARLVAEDPSAFDQKINTENLTKCLQTLKYMYHDLELKGEMCPNEPEFRAYIILLNLNDGSFMWEVQQLRQSIQESKEIKFALQVYSSLDKNNYVKFFKLVSSTTYLNACILMRYFVQVRLSALKTILKCYVPRTSQTTLPVSYFLHILAFENEEAVLEFVENYGLYSDEERTRVIINRKNFSIPEYPYGLERALVLVESKRRDSVGEVVCGRTLPQRIFEQHIPQNSFDEKGYLVWKHPWNKDQENIVKPKIDVVDAPKPTPVWNAPPIQKIPPTSNIFSGFVKQGNIFGGDVTQEKPIQPQKQETDEEAAILLEKKRKMDIEKEKLRKLVEQREKLLEELAEQDRLEKERLELELVEKERLEQELLEEERVKKAEEEERKRLLKIAEDKLERERELMQKLMREQEIKRKKAEMLRKRQEEVKLEQERQAEEAQLKLDVAETISDLVCSVEAKVKKEILREIGVKITHRRVLKAFNKWRELVRRKRKRKALDITPAFYPVRTLEEEAAELKIHSQDLALASIKRYKSGVSLDLLTNLPDTDFGNIDLGDLAHKILAKRYLHLTKQIPAEIFWKISVNLPDESEYKFGLNFLERNLRNCLGWTENENGQTVLMQQLKNDPLVTVCIDKQKGEFHPTKSDSHGFFFMADQFNVILQGRILNALKNLGVFTKIPVVLALQKEENLEKDKLEALVNQGVISDYLIIVDEFTPRNLVNILEEGLIFLATRVETPPPLELDTLKSFVEKNLADLWRRADSFSKWNSNYKDCLKMPNTVIYLHNEAIDRLKKIVLNRACAEFPKFPEIFRDVLRSEIPDLLPCDYKYFPPYWAKRDYLEHLEVTLEALKIPNFVLDWPPIRQQDLQDALLNYCRRIVSGNPEKLYYKAMCVFLRHENFRDVVWTSIIDIILSEILEDLDFSLYGTGFVNQSIYNQLTVVYDLRTLQQFQKSDWFYVGHPIVKMKIQQILQEPEEEDAEMMEDREDSDLDIDGMLEELFKSPRNKNADRIKRELKTCKNLLDDLEDSLVVHRRILDQSGGMLKQLVNDTI